MLPITSHGVAMLTQSRTFMSCGSNRNGCIRLKASCCFVLYGVANWTVRSNVSHYLRVLPTESDVSHSLSHTFMPLPHSTTQEDNYKQSYLFFFGCVESDVSMSLTFKPSNKCSKSNKSYSRKNKTLNEQIE